MRPPGWPSRLQWTIRIPQSVTRTGEYIYVGKSLNVTRVYGDLCNASRGFLLCLLYCDRLTGVNGKRRFPMRSEMWRDGANSAEINLHVRDTTTVGGLRAARGPNKNCEREHGTRTVAATGNWNAFNGGPGGTAMRVVCTSDFPTSPSYSPDRLRITCARAFFLSIHHRFLIARAAAR